MLFAWVDQPRVRAVVRVLLSFYVTNGVSAALGLLVIAGLSHLLLGEAAAAAASVGAIVCIPPDQVAPVRRKMLQLLPGALFGLPLFVAVQALHQSPLYLGLLLVPATFVAFLAGAWGRQGLPIVVSIMFAMIFSMAVPAQAAIEPLWWSGLCFVLGSALYLVWATVANMVLNRRYREQVLADLLLSLAALMRVQAVQFVPNEPGVQAALTDMPLIGRLLQRQSALADQLQAARNVLLETPNTPRRVQLAGMLVMVLELRDHLLASELDLDALKAHQGHYPVLLMLNRVLLRLSDSVESVADALLMGQVPAQATNWHDELSRLRLVAEQEGGAAHLLSPVHLTRSLANRVCHVNDETLRLVGLVRGEHVADMAAVQAAWQVFVSPTAWSWRPALAVWRWRAPTLRHAIRATLAIGTAYALSLVLPWGTHDYWILLTIVVVLRGSLAQTLERRNSRVAGTLIGCVLAGAILSAHLPPLVLLLLLTLAQAMAHAFAVRQYWVTAVAATVLGLLQAHMLSAGASPVFDVLERVADTVLGAVIAWGASYLLPSWERHLIPMLVRRVLVAQARYAKTSLVLGQCPSMTNAPEIEWRLARREAYDSLSALVQATQRSLAEPRAVRPPLASLGLLVARSYQLLAQLTAVKTMLLHNRGEWLDASVQQSMQQAIEAIQRVLSDSGVVFAPGAPTLPGGDDMGAAAECVGGAEVKPWLLRRLQLATQLAAELRRDADQVVG